MAKKYLDFDLVVERSGDGYRARVAGSPAGQATGEFRHPFTGLELENFNLRLGRSARAVRRVDSPELEFAKSFGRRLFESVFAGEIRGVLRSSLDRAERDEAGLRVRLNLSGAPELADLPWEFLYNDSMNRFLALSDATPLVRYLDLPEAIRPLTVRPPIRVLLMISSPTDYDRLDVNREGAKIAEAVADLEERGLVVVDRVENATLAELQRRLRGGPYHIFHFIGHGGFDSNADDGLLIFEDEQERGRKVGAQDLGVLLHDHRPLRLAILNACESARASRNDPFCGTGQTLVQQGLPAVIAMQFEVSDETAICFTHEFYAAIASGYPVDAALAEARKAIYARVSGLEWGTPVLYMRAPDGRIFDVEPISEADRMRARDEAQRTRAATAAAAPVPPPPAAAVPPPLPPVARAAAAASAPASVMPAAVAAPASPAKPRFMFTFSFNRLGFAGAFVVALLLIGVVLPDPEPETVKNTEDSTQYTSAGDAADDRSSPPAAAPEPAPPVARSTPGRAAGRSPAASAPPPANAAPTEDARASVEEAIGRAMRVEMDAFRQLDASLLESIYTGAALKETVFQLQALSLTGMNLVAEISDVTVESVDVSPNGQQARAVVRTKLSATMHSVATGACAARFPEYAAVTVSTLVRSGGGWMISRTEDRGETPEPVECEYE